MNNLKMRRGGRQHLIKTFNANVDMRFDDAVLPEGSASRIVNFNVRSGALTDGYGIEQTELFGERTGKSVWRFTRYDYDKEEYVDCDMYCDEAGKVHYNYGDGWHTLDGVEFSSTPAAVEYRLYGDDCVLMTSPADKMCVWDGVNSVRRITDSPLISSMTMHYERMFATTSGEQCAVYFSDDLDPTNWNDTALSEGGYIQLLDERGRLIKVVDFLNYVYIFREYGISRLTAYSAQEDFSVVNLYVAGGKIYGGSVCPCGDVVMMLDSDGLHSFDGYSVSNKLKAVRFLPSPNASAVFSEGKYYLAACTENEGENDTLVVYDLNANAFTLSRLFVKRLCKLGDEVYAIMHDGRIGRVTECGECFGEPLVKVWESGDMDLQSPDKKTISAVTLRSDGDMTLTIITDGKEKDYEIRGDGGVTRIKPTAAGKTIAFRITSTDKSARIRRLGYLIRS